MEKKGGFFRRYKKINVVIRTLILGDTVYYMGNGIVAPIYAIFLNDQIIGGSIATAGIASTIFLVTKSVLQIPISTYTDKEKGNRAEAITLLIGYGIFMVTPFLYIISTHIWHIFLVEFFFGIGAALSYPGWSAIFTKYADRHREGFESSIFSTASNLGMALSGAVGGIVGELWGFDVLFFAMGIFSIVSFLIYAWFFSQNQDLLATRH